MMNDEISACTCIIFPVSVFLLLFITPIRRFLVPFHCDRIILWYAITVLIHHSRSTHTFCIIDSAVDLCYKNLAGLRKKFVGDNGFFLKHAEVKHPKRIPGSSCLGGNEKDGMLF